MNPEQWLATKGEFPPQGVLITSVDIVLLASSEWRPALPLSDTQDSPHDA